MSLSKKHYIFFILIVLSIFLIGCFVFVRDNTSKKEEEKFVILSKYYVPQVSFTSLVDNVSLKDLKNMKLATFDDDFEAVSQITGNDDVAKIEDEDIYKWKKKTKFKGVVFVPFDKADPKLKTISVGGQLFWDMKEGIEDYPLAYEMSVRKDELSNYKEYDPSSVITYVAGGEVIPARAVARKFRRTGDYTFPFHKVKKLFAAADFSSILLENSINGRPEPCHGCVWFIGDEDFIEGLEYLGVDLVSMAGNHMGDGGMSGIQRTIEVLDKAGIKHSGASIKSQEDASKPAYLNVNGVRFAFLGYDDVAFFHWAREGDHNWGTARISERFQDGSKKMLTKKIVSDLKRAKENSDFVIVMMSWGDREYVNWALDHQREMGHALIDAGADLIVGSHQHWVNEIEFYKGKLIFYGIGNFVFDQTHTDETRQGAFLKFYYYENRLVHVNIIPHQSCGPQQSAVDSKNCTHFQPQILNKKDPAYKKILERMFEYSKL